MALSPIQRIWKDFVIEANKKVIGFCAHCGQPFSGSQPKKNTCSDRCSNAYNQLNKRRRDGQGEKRGRPPKNGN